MRPLKMHDRMKKFMDLLACYIGDGVNCIHFHKLKLRELFWLFRFYHPKMELASFFTLSSVMTMILKTEC